MGVTEGKEGSPYIDIDIDIDIDICIVVLPGVATRLGSNSYIRHGIRCSAFVCKTCDVQAHAGSVMLEQSTLA